MKEKKLQRRKILLSKGNFSFSKLFLPVYPTVRDLYIASSRKIIMWMIFSSNMDMDLNVVTQTPAIFSLLAGKNCHLIVVLVDLTISCFVPEFRWFLEPSVEVLVFLHRSHPTAKVPSA